jgi:sugar phosphate isomerase/epimerase
MISTYPQVYLAIDNVFASKRWTKTDEWAPLIRDMGITCIEASADTECDPLYMGKDYIIDWTEAAKKAGVKYGITIANLYSGHGTYCTLGLTHTDPRVRRRMIDKWFKLMLDAASELNAGLGFFAHAFPEMVMQDKKLYDEYVHILENGLIELNEYAIKTNCGSLGVEMMYSPHQYPYKIEQVKGLLTSVTEKSGRPFYFTEDVGHHTPVFQEGKDADCYAWLSEIGCYSPIIHLQQTDGKTSSHFPFTKERNAWGKIEGGKVLRALKASYETPPEKGMPPRCDKIYLTLELFFPTAAVVKDCLDDVRESAAYWRRFVPQDGMRLDTLCGALQ